LCNTWHDVLEAKQELEHRREDEIRYSRVERGAGFAIFDVDRVLDENSLDQVRFVPVPDRLLTATLVEHVAVIGGEDLRVVA